MIEKLSIQNYAIIESMVIDFDKGLNIITGETGAGKSILLGALNLVLGKRADSKVLFDKNKKCIVEAYFNIQSYNLKSIFEEHDLDYDEELIIRREINKNGKSRAFVNDTPTTLNILSTLSNRLIDLHNQHDSLEIHQTNFQINILDTMGKSLQKVNLYKKKYQNYKEDVVQLASLNKSYAEAKQAYDFNQFQYNELADANLKLGEITAIENDLSQLENVEKIQVELAACKAILDHEQYGLSNGIQDIVKKLYSISTYSETLKGVTERFESIAEEVRDLESQLLDITDSLEDDPERLTELQQRQDVLNRLLTKHNVKEENELIQMQATFEGAIENYSGLEVEIKAVSKRIVEAEEGLKKEAGSISKKRKSVTKKIETEVQKILTELSMKNAILKVDIQQKENIGPNGIDDIDFLFATNKGVEFAPIRKVASGGETSRLNLAIKSLVADKANLPTLIFDEIDTGISGDVALKMGHIISNMSTNHQIISITHSPQVAARANKHFHIYKEDKGDRTNTKLQVLSKADREIEIAKMLSGNPPSKAAINNAKELIK